MTDSQQREAARQFYYKWNGRGKEDEDARSYWIEILQDILGIDHVTDRIDFEKKVIGGDGNTKRIDVYIPETYVLIEQKSLGIPLDKPQVGHGGKTPYQQAKEYDNGLPHSEKSRWIVLSNFAEIWIYDMEQKKPAPVKISLVDFQDKYHMLSFLVNRETKTINEEMKVSLQAGEIVGKLYDAFRKQYKNPDDPETLKSLNKLCVRIVFCLYGEDADVFGKKSIFHDYMAQFDPKSARKGLRDLFRVLNQRPEERDPYLADDDPILASFPYVNGGLFDGEDIEIPPFTVEIMDLLLRNASDDFDWSGISPTIFGAVFESTLNPETRRAGGMHYTSIENIHKVIDPLFLDDLRAELEEIKQIDIIKTREKKLHAFQDKLASLTFLDPAAGSGNFLTESYTCLRKLENEVIKLLTGGQMTFGEAINPIKVSISQFYGIEINDFAVTVARTALWIAENQMLKETEDIVRMDLDFLPLKTNAYIVEGNALRIEWEGVVPKNKLNYIMGNPPFVGKSFQNKSQKSDMENVFRGIKSYGNLDYVASWYKIAADFMLGTGIHAAFVSTNSVCQGIAVPPLWKYLFGKEIIINFAYPTFVWNSEAAQKAAVHCVIIGFSYVQSDCAYLIDEKRRRVKSINAYLNDGPSIIIETRSSPLAEVPPMIVGSCPTDGGGFIIEDKEAFIHKEPKSARFIHLYVGSEEFINNKQRWCLWLKDCPPDILKQMPHVMERVNSVREMRNASKKEQTRRRAETPTLFAEDRYVEAESICIPMVSSERRRYVPMGFVPRGTVVSNLASFIPTSSTYIFGIVTSNVSMAWMRVVGSRLKSDYRYSASLVYNTLPWPTPTQVQKETIEQTAQGILDARALYPDSSLADLYDPLTMPPELRKAHRDNDIAVMKAYGMPIKEIDEAGTVAWLMQLYQEKVEELEKSGK